MTFLKLLQAVLAFVAKYGVLARPVIESELALLLANGTITQAQYNAIEGILVLLLGPAGPHAGAPTVEEFRDLLK